MLWALAALLVATATAIASLGLGRFDVAPGRVLRVLLSPWLAPADPVAPVEWSVVVVVRLPRVLRPFWPGRGWGWRGP